MRKYLIAVLVVLFCGSGLTGYVHAAGEWSKIKDSNGIKLYERPVPGTDLMEYMSVTTMDTRMEVIGEALRDVSQYPEWLSDCETARVEKKYDRNTYVIYILQDPMLIEKRDIILKNETLYDYENGLAKVTFFCTDEVKVPVEKNRVRVTVMNGLFQMEYIGRTKTKFIYKLKADPGGSIPKKVAYSQMKYYTYNSLKKLREVAKNKKYADIARGSEEEKQINVRSTSEANVRKIFGERMQKMVKNKAVMATILAGESEGIRKIAESGSSYEVVEETAKNIFVQYIDKVIGRKKLPDKEKEINKMHDEIAYQVHTASEADTTTVDDIVARYMK